MRVTTKLTAKLTVDEVCKPEAAQAMLLYVDTRQRADDAIEIIVV